MSPLRWTLSPREKMSANRLEIVNRRQRMASQVERAGLQEVNLVLKESCLFALRAHLASSQAVSLASDKPLA